MNYRVWENGNEDEPGPDKKRSHFEAASPEEAAEAYAREVEHWDDLGHSVEINVSAQSGTERVYWTVELDAELSLDFSARRAQPRPGAP